MSKLMGLIAATHTPFDAEGELNLAAVEKQAEFLHSQGIHTVFISGTTGECHSLTVEERLRLTERWSAVVRGTTMQVVVHVGSNCLKDAMRLASDAEQKQAVAVAAFSPSYFKPPDVVTLVECTRQVAQAAPNTPFYFYDIPSLTGVNLPTHEYLARASEAIPTLAGIKFTNIDMTIFQLCRAYQQGQFNILWGTDEMLLSALSMGAQGAVGSTYNFAAGLYHRLISAWESGDLDQARLHQLQSVQLVRSLNRYGYMASSKYLMRRLGVEVGTTRLPLPSLTPAQERELDREWEQMNLQEQIRSGK
jgi:N-acetylneuraminate lyase